MSAAVDTAGTRSNAPVLDLEAALDPVALAAWLDVRFAEHDARVDALAAAYERFLAMTSSGIVDEEVAGRATDFAKAHRAEMVAIDATRTGVKRPVLNAQRLIDGRGNGLATRLKTQIGVIEERLSVFLREKEAAARRLAEAEAARLAALAHEAMLAARSGEPEQADGAIDALRSAADAEALATAPTTELSRTRSANGALSGLRQVWNYEVADIRRVPAGYLMLCDAAIRNAIRNGVREIPGLRIYSEAKTYVR